MKEDILEQMIEDYYVSQSGMFVKHNLKFRPRSDYPGYDSKLDSVHSDVDILAVSASHARERTSERVHAISCKSWQGGFSVANWTRVFEGEAAYKDKEQEKFQPREKWKSFRELVSEKWMDAFLAMVEKETGQRDLTYVIAVTRMLGSPEDRMRLESSQILKERFRTHGSSVEIKVMLLEEIVSDLTKRLRGKTTPALESTDFGRMFQLIHAAGYSIEKK